MENNLEEINQEIFRELQKLKSKIIVSEKPNNAVLQVEGEESLFQNSQEKMGEIVN